MRVYAKFSQEVEVDPIDVLKKINIIPEGDWIRPEETKNGLVYSHYEEVGAGSHSFERKVGEITKEKYDLYMAKIMLINHLEKLQDQKRK